MSADKQLKAYIDRVLRLKEEQDTLGDDIREVYAEAKSEGFDKTIMGKLVAHLRKIQKSGEDAVSEQEMNFDTYLQAYHRASGTVVASHTHEEKFDPATGEFLDDKDTNPRLIQQVVTGMQTETGRAALIAAVDILIEREEAQEFQAKASGDNGATGQADEEAADSMTGDASRTSRGVDTPATNSPEQATEKDALTDGVTNPIIDSVETGILAGDTRSDANTGGEDVTVVQTAHQHQAGGLVKIPPANIIGAIMIEDAPHVPMHRNPLAHCWPDLTKREYEELEDNIRQVGVLEPIVRKGDVILDGWNRYNIARSLGEEYPVIEYDGDNMLIDVIRWQRSSRDWTPQQEAKIAKALAAEVPARAEEIFAAFHIVELPDGEVVAA